MLGLFSLEYAKKYVLTTSPIANIQPHAINAAKEFALSFYAMVLSLLKIIYCIFLILVKLSILAFPHAVKIFHQIVKFHRQLSWSEILLESLTISILLVVMIFYKRIVNWWKRLEKSISAKSKAAAAAAPHVLFFTGAFLFTVLGKKFILPFTSTSMMPVFTLGIPMLRSFRFARAFYNDTNHSIVHRKKYYPLLAQLLTLWVVLGTYHSLVTVFALIPFSNRMLLYVPYLKELVIVILLWIQLSPVFTRIVFVSIILPVINYLSKYIPTAQNNNNPNDQNSNYLMMLLRMSRFFHDRHMDFIGKLLEDSVVTIMAVIFVCVPNPFATMGMMTIACLLPAFRAVSVTEAFRIRGVGSGDKKPNESVLPMYLVDKAMFWLYYWIAFSWLWLWRIYVTPVWPSVTILITLWLQHIFFAGGKFVVINTIEATAIMIQRNRQRPIPRVETTAEQEEDNAQEENRENAFNDSSLDGREAAMSPSEHNLSLTENDDNEEIKEEKEKEKVSDDDDNKSITDRTKIISRRRLEQSSPSVENPVGLLSSGDESDFVQVGGEATVSPDSKGNAARRRNRLS